ncbi:MAG: Rieske 2Fe-2S domain-containing protein [Elusimicrobiales bacterium]|jgi:nitrite reductase/ring-hydroxylating ferredoxin subunit
MLIEAAKVSEIAPGGMLGVKLNGTDLAICNYAGKFYAVERRCGHAGAYLERGALTGYILTCPLHYVQFDITTGEALSGPVPEAPASKYEDPAAPELATRGLKTYPVTIDGDSIKVDLP